MSNRSEILTETIDRLAIAADKQNMKQWLIECHCGCKKTRLLFVGPAASVEDGGWIDNNNIVLLGMEERKNDGMKVPVIWKYHLPTKSFYLYEYPEPIRFK